MFKECVNLAELNAKRIQLLQEPDANRLAINNAYNTRKAEIVKSSEHKNTFIKLTPIIVEPDPVQKYDGIPFIGEPMKNGVITLQVPTHG